MSIKEALEQLDPTDDSHWTAEGAPLVDVVSKLHGQAVTRKEITDDSPNFNRVSWARTLTELAEAGIGKEVSEQLEADEKVATCDVFEGEIPSVDAINDADDEADAVADEEVEELAPLSVDEAFALRGEDFVAEPALFELAKEALDAHAVALKEAVKKLQDELENTVQRSSAIQDLQSRIQPKHNPVLDYIKGQNKLRAEKAERAKMFLKSGTNAKDVVGALQHKSALDQAMSQRKAAPGATRPSRLPDRSTPGD